MLKKFQPVFMESLLKSVRSTVTDPWNFNLTLWKKRQSHINSCLLKYALPVLWSNKLSFNQWRDETSQSTVQRVKDIADVYFALLHRRSLLIFYSSFNCLLHIVSHPWPLLSAVPVHTDYYMMPTRSRRSVASIISISTYIFFPKLCFIFNINIKIIQIMLLHWIEPTIGVCPIQNRTAKHSDTLLNTAQTLSAIRLKLIKLKYLFSE